MVGQTMACSHIGASGQNSLAHNHRLRLDRNLPGSHRKDLTPVPQKRRALCNVKKIDRRATYPIRDSCTA